MVEWDLRFVNLFNMYLLRIFSMVGYVVGIKDILMNKELWFSEKIDK